MESACASACASVCLALCGFRTPVHTHSVGTLPNMAIIRSVRSCPFGFISCP